MAKSRPKQTETPQPPTTIEGRRREDDGKKPGCSHLQQSPIVIDDTQRDPSPLHELKPRINYQPTPLRLIHNVHSVTVPYQLGSTLDLRHEEENDEARVYHLREFHFHVPAEHQIPIPNKHRINNNPFYSMEFHLVHQSVIDETYAVIAVFVNVTDPQPGKPLSKSQRFVQRIAQNLPKDIGEFATGNIISAELILPENLSYFYYCGSLTTYPFIKPSHDPKPVRWIICREPVTALRLDVEYLTETLVHNSRKCQHLNPGTRIAQYP